MAEGALELGFYISFSGIVTFKERHALKEVARRVPLERLLVETDSPYLAPCRIAARPTNRPMCAMSPPMWPKLRGMALEDLAAASTDNFLPCSPRRRVDIELTILGCGSSSGTPAIGCDCPTCASPDPKTGAPAPALLRANGVNFLIDTGPDLRQQTLRETCVRWTPCSTPTRTPTT